MAEMDKKQEATIKKRTQREESEDEYEESSYGESDDSSPVRKTVTKKSKAKIEQTDALALEPHDAPRRRRARGGRSRARSARSTRSRSRRGGRRSSRGRRR
ncbi:uncharacterized protein LOC129907316 [Episyrphus balteatus]|uniref:uncharacterized protein LOC129907316 n=1 Tax=Episyrphus balteatus TaxID=286459 RepID=UPI002486AE1F|nr:uncharacterized protein LOC129907316 [Episyrphus balteatus]